MALLTSATAARTNLGLGTAATQSSSAFAITHHNARQRSLNAARLPNHNALTPATTRGSAAFGRVAK